MTEHQFQGTSGNFSLTIRPGHVCLIGGANGVGKSSLLYEIYRRLGENVSTFLPGHRQININSGLYSSGQDKEQLLKNLYQQIDHFGRYKNAWAEDQFKVVLRSLQHAEESYNRRYRHSDLNGRTVSRLFESPLDKVNNIFSIARFSVQFDINDDGLVAVRENQVYPVQSCSDGERAALFVIAAWVTLPENGVLLIDEPERHLNPSITGPLFAAALRSRRDVALVVSTHDVHLIESLPVDEIYHIKNSEIVSVRPETRRYKLAVFKNGEGELDEIKGDILGARDAILFVEGSLTSLDINLYQHVYNGVKIIPRGGYAEVKESVKALRKNSQAHWIYASGIIDRDGRSDGEVAALSEDGVFPIFVPSVENFYFLESALEAYASILAELKGQPAWADIRQEFTKRISTVLQAELLNIANCMAAWALERRLSAEKIAPRNIRNNSGAVTIDVSEILESADKQVANLLEEGDVFACLKKLYIKKTKVLSEAAKAVGALSFDDYCSTLLHHLDVRSPHIVNWKDEVGSLLPAPQLIYPPTF